MAYKVLSKYFSSDEKRSATVYADTKTGLYTVSVMTDSGTSFTSSFEEENSAENFAEDWVEMYE